MRWHAKPLLACIRACLVVATLCASQAALAGRNCAEVAVGVRETQQAFESAFRLQQLLNTGNQKVVVIARRGQHLDKYGITYSHAAFVVKDTNGKGWSVFHDLNLCGGNVSRLYEQGLAEFYADDLVNNEIALAIPEPWLQDRLVELLASTSEQLRMHEARYSAVAYPFSTRYQNSNGWLIETFARAVSNELLPNRVAAQQWLKKQLYMPSVLHLGMGTRLGGRLLKANIEFDDHPGELRWNNRITVNTADDVMRFVARYSIPQPQCPHGSFPEAICVVK